MAPETGHLRATTNKHPKNPEIIDWEDVGKRAIMYAWRRYNITRWDPCSSLQTGTGSGKTLAMILPVLSFSKTSVVITVSPLRLIQDNHVSPILTMPRNAG
ncbi:hypothetical protein B0H14DRAFT_193693, partial [Mycena olivaceomarginata]